MHDAANDKNSTLFPRIQGHVPINGDVLMAHIQVHVLLFDYKVNLELMIVNSYK